MLKLKNGDPKKEKMVKIVEFRDEGAKTKTLLWLWADDGLDWFSIADSVHLEMLKNGDAEGCEISELELESRWSVVDLV